MDEEEGDKCAEAGSSCVREDENPGRRKRRTPEKGGKRGLGVDRGASSTSTVYARPSLSSKLASEPKVIRGASLLVEKGNSKRPGQDSR